MKAILCTKYGPPEVLQLVEIEKPVPKPNEVLIKVIATIVTSGDYRARSFIVPKGYWLPARLMLGITKPRKKILGAELAGEIEAVGSAVTRFKVGDPVFAAVGFGPGSNAEYVCVPEDGPLAIKPANLSYEEAAAIPFGGLTALYFLGKGKVQREQHVLIYGASGAVGTAAVQVAKSLGAEVTGVCSTANLTMVMSLGADHVIDYTQEDYAQNSETYDVVFDAVDKTSFAHCKPALKPGGMYLSVEMTLNNLFLMLRTSITGGRKVFTGVGTETQADMITLREMAEAGTLKAVIDRRYPFEQIPDAHRYVEKGHKKGNVVIAVAHG